MSYRICRSEFHLPGSLCGTGRVKDMTQVCFVVWPVLYSSLYGRFLLLQLSNVGSVVVMNFMFACFDIAGALADRGSDAWWLKLLYGSERAKDAMQSTYVSVLAKTVQEINEWLYAA